MKPIRSQSVTKIHPSRLCVATQSFQKGDVVYDEKPYLVSSISVLEMVRTFLTTEPTRLQWLLSHFYGTEFVRKNEKPNQEENLRQLAASLSMEEKVIQKVYDVLTTNYLNCRSLGGVVEQPAFFKTISFMNHSCSPNTKLEDMENSSGTFSSKQVIALSDIKQGEELTFSYQGVLVQHSDGKKEKRCDLTLLSLSQRKQLLKNAYGFDCACNFCTK